MNEIEALEAEIAEKKALLLEMKRNKRCCNCGKPFRSKNSNAKFCSSPSPQEPRLTCSEYNSRRLSYKKMKSDSIAHLSRNILSAKCMASKRNPEKKRDYDIFRKERLKWKNKYENGVVSAEEYKTWLVSMKG